MLDLAVPMAFVVDEVASTNNDVGTVDVSMEPIVNPMATDTHEESMEDITETASIGNLGTVDESMDLTNNGMETDTPRVDKYASIIYGKVLFDVVNDSALITSLCFDGGSTSMDITKNVLSNNEEVSQRVSSIRTSESCSINT
jgi:hypothetical protein